MHNPSPLFILPPTSVSRLPQIKSTFVFRAEDPYNLHQVLPPRVVHTTVERIKGNRWPAPGSRTIPTVRVPLLENEDDIYNTNYYTRDPKNLPSTQDGLYINSKKPTLMSGEANMHPVSHGKRAIADLVYDPSGLRTTKTATWASALPVLQERIGPTHLPGAEWLSVIGELHAIREAKGLPPPVGRRYKMVMDKNYNEVRW
jgi:hypothetical protein